MTPPMIATCMYRKSWPKGFRFWRRDGRLTREQMALTSAIGRSSTSFMIQSMNTQQRIMPRTTPMRALITRQRSSSR